MRRCGCPLKLLVQQSLDNDFMRFHGMKLGILEGTSSIHIHIYIYHIYSILDIYTKDFVSLSKEHTPSLFTFRSSHRVPSYPSAFARLNIKIARNYVCNCVPTCASWQLQSINNSTLPFPAGLGKQRHLLVQIMGFCLNFIGFISWDFMRLG